MKISVLITSLIQLHTAQLYLDELEKRKYNIIIYTYKFIAKEVSTKNVEFVFIEKLGFKNRFIKICHFTLILLFTPKDFSPMYLRWIEQRVGRFKILLFISKLLVRTPLKLKKDKINKLINKIISFFNLKIFKTPLVLNFTTNDQPHLLCQKDVKTITVVESWDHPYKFPIGYSSSLVLLWNKKLSNDWRIIQGDNNLSTGYQAKFDYLIDSNNYLHNEKKIIKTIMYPFSTSSHSDNLLYKDELKFVKYLSEISVNNGFKFLIKPKPSTPIGELDFLKTNKNIVILSYQKSIDGANYNLSKLYNQIRIKELKKVDIVFSRGTTFVFDAAIYGLPIVLFNFKSQNFPGLSKLNYFPHLSRHLFSQKNLIYEIKDNNNIDRQIEIIFTQKFREKGLLFTEYLKNWIGINDQNNICNSTDMILNIV